MPKLKDERFPAWHMRNLVGGTPVAAAPAPAPDKPATDPDQPAADADQPAPEPDKPAGKKTTK